MQQHSLKTSKTFQTAQDHKDRRILTASNVDSLVVTLGKLQQQQHYGSREASIGSPPRAGVKPSRSFTNSYMKQCGILEPSLPAQPPLLPLDDIAVWTIYQQPATPRKRLYLDRSPAVTAPNRAAGYYTSRARLAPLDATVLEPQPSSHSATSSSGSRDGALKSMMRQKHIMSLSNGVSSEQQYSSSSNKQGSLTGRYTAPTSKQRYTTDTPTIMSSRHSKRGSLTARSSGSTRSFNTTCSKKTSTSEQGSAARYCTTAATTGPTRTTVAATPSSSSKHGLSRTAATPSSSKHGTAAPSSSSKHGSSKQGSVCTTTLQLMDTKKQDTHTPRQQLKTVVGRSWNTSSTCSSASSSHEQAESLMDEEPYYMCGHDADDDEDMSYGGEDLGYEEDSIQEGGEDSLQEGGEDSLQEGGEMELMSCLDEESEAASSVDDLQSLADDIDQSLAHLLLTTHEESDISYRVSLPRAAPVVTTGSPTAPAAVTDTTSLQRSGPSSPLTPSLFSYRPPSIHFPLHNEPYNQLPKRVRSLLKWKMSTITPNIVKDCIDRVGFTRCTKGSSWIGYWGKHMKSDSFKIIREHQKINHFPGTFQMGRKDQLWRNMYRMMLRHGKKEYGFVPQTFVLPQDLKLLKRTWDDGGDRKKWILKPPASARGIGIRVVHQWKQIPKKRSIVVQKYLSNPFLINSSKFDLRIYVYISSYDHLRVYIFKDGLVRFATCKYTQSNKRLSNRFIHLTNYSVNKKNADFIPNSDETVCQGHKWGLLALWEYMRTQLHIDPAPVWNSIKDLVVKTAISCEASISSLVKAHVKERRSVHELFGFDVMLDRNLKPWLLEVNISPSLHSNSNLDINIKGQMMRDLLNMAMFRVPAGRITDSCCTTRYFTLTQDDRLKHAKFTRELASEEERHTILDSLTRDDCRVLMETEDEYSRRGEFIRVLPAEQYGRYGRYYEREKYYNILLEEWTKRYHTTPFKGIALLERLNRDWHLADQRISTTT